MFRFWDNVRRVKVGMAVRFFRRFIRLSLFCLDVEARGIVMDLRLRVG